jgi:hypothetical protein
MSQPVKISVEGSMGMLPGVAPCGFPNAVIECLYGPGFEERCRNCATLTECCGIEVIGQSGKPRDGPIPLFQLVLSRAIDLGAAGEIELRGPHGSALITFGDLCDFCSRRNDCPKRRKKSGTNWLVKLYHAMISWWSRRRQGG